MSGPDGNSESPFEGNDSAVPADSSDCSISAGASVTSSSSRRMLSVFSKVRDSSSSAYCSSMVAKSNLSGEMESPSAFGSLACRGTPLNSKADRVPAAIAERTATSTTSLTLNVIPAATGVVAAAARVEAPEPTETEATSAALMQALWRTLFLTSALSTIAKMKYVSVK